MMAEKLVQTRESVHSQGDRSLKVCLASMAPFVGGAEVAAERLAVGLRDAGHDVLMLLGQRGDVLQRIEQSGLRCVVLPMYFTDKWHWWRYLSARNGIRRLLKHEQPDIVHSNDMPTHQIISDAARPLGMPRLCHHRYPDGGSCIDWLIKYGAERHLFVSRALMDEMCASSTKLRQSSRTVVYDGLVLPPRPTSADRLAARRKLGLPEDKLLVTFAGQIIERKGVADLIRAWTLIDPGVARTAELLLVGDDLKNNGAYRIEMEKLAAELRCPARFVGFQRGTDTWLIASDIAVVPSHIEPLGNATLEAMACVLPVIGGDVGGIPEMIVHDSTGLLVPPRCPNRLAVALTRLLQSADLRQCFGAEGRQRCENLFALDVHVRNVLKEYRQVLESHRPVAAC